MKIRVGRKFIIIFFLKSGSSHQDAIDFVFAHKINHFLASRLFKYIKCGNYFLNIFNFRVSSNQKVDEQAFIFRMHGLHLFNELHKLNHKYCKRTVLQTILELWQLNKASLYSDAAYKYVIEYGIEKKSIKSV